MSSGADGAEAPEGSAARPRRPRPRPRPPWPRAAPWRPRGLLRGFALLELRDRDGVAESVHGHRALGFLCPWRVSARARLVPGAGPRTRTCAEYALRRERAPGRLRAMAAQARANVKTAKRQTWESARSRKTNHRHRRPQVVQSVRAPGDGDGRGVSADAMGTDPNSTGERPERVRGDERHEPHRASFARWDDVSPPQLAAVQT